MSGWATAIFECGATVEGKACGKDLTVPLYNDGQYTAYNYHPDWHIALGLSCDGADTIVRCPQHCDWSKMGESPTGQPYALPGGEWIDAP